MREMRLRRRAFHKPGRLTPSGNRGLRGRAVRLGPGDVMDWHTTGDREELLLGMAGCVRVELEGPRRIRRIVLAAGQSLFLPHRIRHRVVNASGRAGSYVYVTGRC